MSENILHFYKLKTEREPNEVNQPYRKIMDSKMERANQFSDKIILNKVYMFSIWGKIIKDLIDKVEDKKVVKSYINFIDALIKEKIILTEEYQRSNITQKIYSENSLVLEELKDLKNIYLRRF